MSTDLPPVGPAPPERSSSVPALDVEANLTIRPTTFEGPEMYNLLLVKALDMLENSGDRMKLAIWRDLMHVQGLLSKEAPAAPAGSQTLNAIITSESQGGRLIDALREVAKGISPPKDPEQ